MRFLLFFSGSTLLLSCYSMTSQDRSQTLLARELTNSATCDLMQLDASTAPAQALRAEVKMRAAHAAIAGVVRRNEVDGGPVDVGVSCP